MTRLQTFQEDCVELLRGKLDRGEIDRRRFLTLAGALGVTVAVGGERASAQAAKEVVLVNWGGIANDGFGNHYGKPFEARNPGTRVVMDSSGPSAGKIRAMVESRKVTWDLCDSSAGSSILLGNAGLLEPVNYDIVKKSDLPPAGFAYPFGAAPYSFSSILIYDHSRFGNDPPKSWADFLDFRKYPGKRMLRRDAAVTLDALLMGEGVPMDRMYPLDAKRGLDIARRIRKDCVYWNSGSESEQLMRTGEASMGLIWHTRAKILSEEPNSKLRFIWNQGVLQPGIFVIPKGNPAGVAAQHLLASMCGQPEPQVELLKFLGNGPTNPRAAALVPPEFRRFNPTDPENARHQLVVGGEWWGANYAQVNQDYLDAIAG